MKDIKTQPVVDERSSSTKSCRTYTPPTLVSLNREGPGANGEPHRSAALPARLGARRALNRFASPRATC